MAILQCNIVCRSGVGSFSDRRIPGLVPARLLLCLLSASLLPGPLLLGNSTVDIQLHDTYYVIGGSDWAGNIFFMPFIPVLFLSWVLYFPLRKHELIVAKWRSIQVWVSVICMLLIAYAIKRMSVIASQPLNRRDFIETLNSYGLLTNLLAIALILLILCQLIFWVGAAWLLIRNTRPPRAPSTATRPPSIPA